jgi:hypothetical protein
MMEDKDWPQSRTPPRKLLLHGQILTGVAAMMMFLFAGVEIDGGHMGLKAIGFPLAALVLFGGALYLSLTGSRELKEYLSDK